MSNEDDWKRTIELLTLLKSVNQDTNKNKDTEDNFSSKISSVTSFVFTIISIIGFVIFIGMKTQTWDDSAHNTKLEISKEFAEKFAGYQSTISDNYIRSSNDIRLVADENKNLRIIISNLEDRLDEQEERLNKQDTVDDSLKRSYDELYRTQQWLKSQHNINIPPQ